MHATDLPTWRLIRDLLRDLLSVIPDRAFDEMLLRRRALGIDTILVNDPEGIRHILTTNPDNYGRPMVFRRVSRPVTGEGLILAEGAEWRRQRRLLAPIFTPATVSSLLPHFAEAATGLIRCLEGTLQANLFVTFHLASLDAVLKALFSLPHAARSAQLAGIVRGYLKGPGRPNILDVFAKSETAFEFASGARRRFQKEWNAVVDDVVTDRRRVSRADPHRDLLDLLLAARDPETGEALADTEIRDQCATMIVVGYEPTARLLFWASYLVALAQNEQDKLRAEIARFPPHCVSKLDDLQNWPRLRRTLLEALRLYPPTPFMTREAVADDVISGEPVRAGTLVLISPWVLHRHRKFWDNPTAFMPDRFADRTPPWTSGPFMPFGGGPRICIGASFGMVEAQIMLATLLSRFRITYNEPRPVMPVATPFMAPRHEPMFGLERV